MNAPIITIVDAPPPAAMGGRPSVLGELVDAARAAPGKWASVDAGTVNRATSNSTSWRKHSSAVGCEIVSRGTFVYLRVRP